MTARPTIWRVVIALFTLVNAGGAVYAAAAGEALHAGAHLALALLGAYLVWRVILGRGARRERQPAQTPPALRERAERLTNLEQSVDAVAIEIERIGEAQRFMTRVLTADRDAAGVAAAPSADGARGNGGPPRRGNA